MLPSYRWSYVQRKYLGASRVKTSAAKFSILCYITLVICSKETLGFREGSKLIFVLGDFVF